VRSIGSSENIFSENFFIFAITENASTIFNMATKSKSKSEPTVQKGVVSKQTKPPVSKKVLHVFINTNEDTTVRVHQWKIKPTPKSETPDHPRVDVQTEDLSYSVILDPSEPKVESWRVNSLGELGSHPIATLGLPFLTTSHK